MLKFSKSSPPRKNFKYSDPDIVKAITDDFFDICYICEECTRHLQVEHFYPKWKFKKLENSWYNLFNGCEKCNNIKSTMINISWKTRIINCCKDDPTLLLSHRIKFLRIDKIEIEVLPLSNIDSKYTLPIQNTINLLDKIYNGFSTSSYSYVGLRKEIAEELAEFTSDLDKYKNVLDKNHKASLKRRIIEKIQKATRNKKFSSYISFKRQMLKEDALIGSDFLSFFD